LAKQYSCQWTLFAIGISQQLICVTLCFRPWC